MRNLYIYCIVLLIGNILPAFSQINIWEGVKNHPKVELTPYLVPGSNNDAIVICPGGSYFWHASKTEGHEVARWLQKNGIASFVLNYRVAKFPAYMFHHRLLFRGVRYPDAQDDICRALHLIKTNAKKFGVDKDKVGAMGFSAGGHLAMTAAIFAEKEDRPNFLALLYPVVTMEKDCVHKRSRRALLGDNRTKNVALRDSLSLENHVPADCPPVFLMNCKDDPIVNYHNSMLLDSALTVQHIDHKYVFYNTGGHGFGVDSTKGTKECHQWEDEFLRWIDTINL